MKITISFFEINKIKYTVFCISSVTNLCLSKKETTDAVLLLLTNKITNSQAIHMWYHVMKKKNPPKSISKARFWLQTRVDVSATCC